ncbi:MAG: hypothetical protein HC839_04880 [Leptolyngbyaceae cyanobacterium RM2_2_21]|nr:hypothetical protein [Leptolyngbyaceae cyanobacterium RM2_2_21]
MRDPQFATSPLWQESPLLERRDRVLAEVDRAYTAWIAESPDENFTRYLHQVRGALRWWRGDFNAAKEDWENWGTPLQQTILELSVNAEEGEDFSSLQPSERNAIALGDNRTIACGCCNRLGSPPNANPLAIILSKLGWFPWRTPKVFTNG